LNQVIDTFSSTSVLLSCPFTSYPVLTTHMQLRFIRSHDNHDAAIYEILILLMDTFLIQIEQERRRYRKIIVLHSPRSSPAYSK